MASGAGTELARKKAAVKSSWTRQLPSPGALFAIGFTLVAFLTGLLATVSSSGPALRMGGVTKRLEVASTPSARRQGLSGRESLPSNQGMLFVFDHSDKYCFWMKDMRFPLDMVWLDAHKRVVKIERGVAPESYPRPFCPSSPARYVIELNAGQADTLGIEVGRYAQLHLERQTIVL